MKVLRYKSEGMSSLSSFIWEGMGLMVWIAKKIRAVIHTSKDSDFPPAFLLRCAELSLDRGYTSQKHFPNLIPANFRSLSCCDLCAIGRT